jgi:hypothetical protein
MSADPFSTVGAGGAGRVEADGEGDGEDAGGS